MANKRREPIGYRPFTVSPLLADGLLPVPRHGGELEEKVAAAFFRIADELDAVNNRRQAAAGERQGALDAIAGRPRIGVEGGGGSVAPGKPYKTSDPVASDLPPQARALLNAVAGGESAGAYNVRYTPKGGAFFSDLSRHPNISEQGPHGPSSAAGRYQFLFSTWNRMGGGDFSPANQDRRAWDLAQQDYSRNTGGRKLLADLEAGGLTNNIISALSPTWEAWQRNRGRHIATYNDSLTRFVGQGNAAPPPTGANTAGVDPAVQAPKVTVSGGAFRPSGRDTHYGRAYDAAGTRTYLQALNVELESSTDQLYEKYKDNPSGLSVAMQDLKADLIDKEVFPEILPEFELTFDRRAGALVMRAQRELEKRQEEQNRADFLGRVNDLETQQARALAGLDPNDDASVAAFQATQAALDDHYDAAVAHGLVDANVAAEAKARSRGNAALGFYKAQVKDLDAEDTRALHEKLRSDFAAGTLEGVDADTWKTLDSSLENAAEQKENEEKRAIADLEKRTGEFAARVASGFEPEPGALSRFMLDAGKTEQGRELIRATNATLSAARFIGDAPLAAGMAYVEGLKKQYGAAPTDGQLLTLTTAASVLEGKRKAIVSDSRGYAEARGIVPATPMLTEAATTADMVTIMRERVATAPAASQKLGVAPRFLKAGEAAALGKKIRENPEAGAMMAAAIVAGAGGAAADVLAEFGTDAPVIAEAGGILAGGGSPQAAEDVILGYGRGADGKQLKGLKPEAARSSFVDIAGGSMVYVQKDSLRIERAAAAIARKRISEQGLDPESEEAAAIHSQAVHEAAGAVFDRGVQWGGFVEVNGAQVLVPPQIRADSFEEMLGAITDADLAGLKVKPRGGSYTWVTPEGSVRQPLGLAATLRQARPVIVSGGYAFAMGDPASGDPQFVQGDDGKVFVLDFAALAPVLGARVPGAFR